jgi:hypothetical protein
MTIEQFENAMIQQLKNLNDKGFNPITRDTIHNQVLSDNDGFGTANSKNIYKALIRWILKKNGHQDKNWPSNWFSLSINQLAQKIL